MGSRFLDAQDSKSKNLDIKYNYSEKYHTLQVFKNNLKIEFDSIDFWQRNLKLKYQKVKFNNTIMNILSLHNLTTIYKKASKVSKDNPKCNRKKYLTLKLLQ